MACVVDLLHAGRGRSLDSRWYPVQLYGIGIRSRLLAARCGGRVTVPGVVGEGEEPDPGGDLEGQLDGRAPYLVLGEVSWVPGQPVADLRRARPPASARGRSTRS